MEAHVCCWVETGLVLSQFATIKKALSPHRHTVFGAPVTKRKNMTGVGEAAGTAVIALKPFSIYSSQLNTSPMYFAGRFMVSDLFMPNNTHFKIILVYAFVGKSAQAPQANKALFQEVRNLAASIPCPCLIAGDFNMRAPEISWLSWLNSDPWTCLNTFFNLGNVATFQHALGSQSVIDFVFANNLAMPWVKHMAIDSLHAQGHAAIRLDMRTDRSYSTINKIHEVHSFYLDKHIAKDIRSKSTWRDLDFRDLNEYDSASALKYWSNQVTGYLTKAMSACQIKALPN